MNKLSVVYKRVEDLIPYVNNARTHSDEQVSQIAASIKEFGFNNPILLDGDNGVIAGHGRLMAAKKLGLVEAPCIELAGLSDAQKKAYILADNRIALNSDWDDELLKTELNFLKDNNENFLEKIGFSNDELKKLFDLAEEGNLPDEAEYKMGHSIIIECESEAEQEELFDEFQNRGLKCRLHDL